MKNLLEKIKRLRKLAGKPDNVITAAQLYEIKEGLPTLCDALERAIIISKKSAQYRTLTDVQAANIRALLKKWGVE